MNVLLFWAVKDRPWDQYKMKLSVIALFETLKELSFMKTKNKTVVVNYIHLKDGKTQTLDHRRKQIE